MVQIFVAITNILEHSIQVDYEDSR